MRIDVQEYTRILPIKQLVEERLLRIPGVTGVDVGLKEVGGERTSTLAILVFVAKKGVFNPEDEIPGAIGGVATDVIEAVWTHLIGRLPAAAAIDTTRYDPAQGGANIAPARFDDMYGTLGMLVKDAASGDNLWLSVYHVMCVDPSWSKPGVDTRITQPAVGVGGNPGTDTIGSVVRGKYGQVVVPWGYDLYVDCAVATVSGRAASRSIVSVGAPKGARNASLNDLVEKYGSTTGLRHGVVESTNCTVIVDDTTFYYQYRVGPPFPGSPPLGEGGDSGAAVVDSDFYAIGLLMSGSGKYTTVNPIGQILEALQITMP